MLSVFLNDVLCSVVLQDEAVVSIVNTECAVREAGFFGCSPANRRGGGGTQSQRQPCPMEGVYCFSTIETASFWHYSSAQRVGHFPALRAGLGVDYLVSCWHEEESGEVYILGGNNSGEGLICEVTPSSVRPIGSLAGGHSDILRCAVTVPRADGKQKALLSGGEDGRLCMWKDRGCSFGSGDRSEDGMSAPPIARADRTGPSGSQSRGGAAATQRNKSKNIRYTPF